MKIKSLRVVVFYVLILGLALTIQSAFAQTMATVTGLVTDSQGAVMPGVTVVLSNPSTGVSYQVTTNSVGSYRVPNVPPGPGYTIEFTYQGFSPYQVKDLYVNVAIPARRTRRLRRGPLRW